MAQTFTPLSELPPEIYSLELPDYVPADKIGVNTQRLGRIAQWACVQPDIHLGMYSGKVTEYTAGVGNVGADGSATFGLHGLQRKEPLSAVEVREKGCSHQQDQRLIVANKEAKTLSIYVYVDRFLSHTNPGVTIRFNMPEMQDRLAKASLPVREPQHWAKLLDKGLTKGICDAAKQHLIYSYASKSELLTNGMLDVSAMAILAGLNMWFRGPEADASYWSDVATLVALFPVVQNLWKIAGKRMSQADNLCFSMLPGLHFDRLAMVNALARSRRLVKAL